MQMTYAHYIAGRWREDGAKAFAAINPAKGTELGTGLLATQAQIDEGLASARRGFDIWRSKSAHERAQILRDAAAILRSRQAEIAMDLVREQGKILAEAMVEVAVSADMIDWSASEGVRQYGRVIPARDARFTQMVTREPVGVSVLIPSWNVPVMFVARKLSECLAAGCSAILVGNKQTPRAAINVLEAFIEAGLPADVVNLLFGRNEFLVDSLLAGEGVAKVSFTGGTETGKVIAAKAAANLVHATLELGGHAPAIVFDDVDVEATARILVASKYRNAGQVCNSPTRFYVHQGIYDTFVEAFCREASKLKVGDGAEAGVQMGPLASARQLERIDGLVGDAVAKGGRLLLGGTRDSNQGYFYQPTVIDQLGEDSRILAEEPFGPVATLLPFDDREAMMRHANGLGYGLAGYAYTNSVGHAHYVSENLRVGMLGINTPQISLPETPFGGVKESGHGSEGGTEGVAAYMVTKYVSQFAA